MLTKVLVEAVSKRINYRNVKELYGKYVEVDSSNIHAILYLPDKKILRIRFKGNNKEKGERATFGSEYQYFRVPIRVFISLLNAPSHGKEFWRIIRKIYKYSRLADWEDENIDDEDFDIDDEEADIDDE